MFYVFSENVHVYFFYVYQFTPEHVFFLRLVIYFLTNDW